MNFMNDNCQEDKLEVFGCRVRNNKQRTSPHSGSKLILKFCPSLEKDDMKSVSQSIGLAFTINPYILQYVLGQITPVYLIHKLSSRADGKW